VGKNQTGRLVRLADRVKTAVRTAERRPQDFLLALAVAAILVSLVALIGQGSSLVLPQLDWPGFHYIGDPHNVLTFMSNWDSPDYINIAISGYSSNFWVNWFPLFPITIHLAHLVIPSALWSALTVGWIFLVGALYFYIKVARHLLRIDGDIEPLTALMLFVLLPTGIFLVVPFAEGLLAMLGLGAVYFALQKRILPASVLAMLASATHITGIFFAVLVGLILLEEKVKWTKALGAVVVGSFGLLAYMTYLWDLMGRPLAFLESQQIFHHWTQAGVVGIVTNMSASNFLNAVLLIVAYFYWKRRGRLSLGVFSLLFLTIPLVGHQYGGFDRYVLMAFPVPLMAYDFLRRRQQLLPYVYAFLGMAWAYNVILYTGGYIGS
jgi:hypothetical protein